MPFQWCHFECVFENKTYFYYYTEYILVRLRKNREKEKGEKKKAQPTLDPSFKPKIIKKKICRRNPVGISGTECN